MHFTKMHGLGNDFIMIENLDASIEDKMTLGKKLCDRHFGIGGDGVLFIEKSDIADIKMSLINSDGSVAEMCGNGIRCFGKYVYENNIVKKDIIEVETLAGKMIVHLNIEEKEVKSVKINMGAPLFEKDIIPFDSDCDNLNYKLYAYGKEYKAATVLMGVPHTVVYSEPMTEEEVAKVGSYIETLAIFPKKTNVNFIFNADTDKIIVRTWERGAGLTLACGTGACASLVVSNILNKTNNSAEVVLSNGSLFIEYDGKNVFMEGPAEVVYSGEINI